MAFLLCGRVAFSKHERNRERALCPPFPSSSQTTTHRIHHPASTAGGGPTCIEGTNVNAPGSSFTVARTRAVPPRALPLRDRLQRARRADERQRGREKDGGEGRGETLVPGCAVQRLLRGFSPREIRQRHREHQRGERCFFLLN